MHEEHFESLKKIKLLCLDFDGVFTTGHTFLGEDGRRLYRFSIHDGMGLVLLHAAEIDVAVMTFSNNEVIAERMRRLKIPHLDMGAHDKGEAVERAKEKFGVDYDEIAYLSDDVNDLPALRKVGLPCAAGNARDEVKAICKLQCKANGGDGAIRELCDALLYSRGLNLEELWAKTR